MRTFLVFFFFTCSLAATALHFRGGEKIILIQVESTGLVRVGRDTVSSDNLARYLQDRLFKSYMGTGQMQDRIRLEKADDEVPETVLNVITGEIREGQQRALRELCMQKHRKYFESLDKNKQARIRKKFPVLFQTDYFH